MISIEFKHFLVEYFFVLNFLADSFTLVTSLGFENCFYRVVFGKVFLVRW